MIYTHEIHIYSVGIVRLPFLVPRVLLPEFKSGKHCQLMYSKLVLGKMVVQVKHSIESCELVFLRQR